MAAISNATPLLALDAVVVDSETTGLDPASARIIEVAAVRLISGRIDTADTFRRLVRPDVPIPALATQIHRIDDAAVAQAPSFAEIWPDLSLYIGSGVVIGHTVGFDLAVLRHECERASIAWSRPRVLDIQLLAEIAEPELAGYSLDELAAWLGVEITNRHSALGDALTTARIFRALVPKLREGRIRTLAEAMQACRALTDVLDRQHHAGWVAAAEAPVRVDTERALRLIDSYPYRHRSGDVMSAPAKFVTPGTSLGAALDQMDRDKISSLFVFPAIGESAPRPQETGIVTERDVLRTLARHGASALALPVEQIMTRPLVSVPADDFISHAIARMSRFRIRHLGVTDDSGHLIGALSARDLLRLRAEGVVSFGDEIDQAEDNHDLAAAWAKLPRIAAALLAEEVSARGIAAVISRSLVALTRRASVLAERRMQDEDRGAPPCAYAMAVLGSAGRGESLFAMDQDNALVFAEGEPGGAQDLWFEVLATHVADILHEVGLPYCKGGVMAKNAPWRGSLTTWRDRVNDWIRRSNPRDLLSVDIFFDMRGVHGDIKLANDLWRYAFDRARDEVGFAKLLVESVGPIEQGLGLFGRFRSENGRINLKKTGLFGIVTMARALAIRHHVVERSTPERIVGIRALGIGGESDLEALVEAHGVFLDLILDQQIDDIDHGRPATNAILIKRLSNRGRDRLHSALAAVKNLDELTRDLLFRE